MKKENGITLVALIVTVVVLLILTSVSIISGTESVDATRLQGFYMQLEIIQKRVDNIQTTNESYIINKDGVETVVELKNAGEELKNEQIAFLQNILDQREITITTANNFRYFTIQNLEEQLDLDNIDYNVFIDFENRIIVAEDCVDIGGNKYYLLENQMYNIDQNTNKNTGTIEALEYLVTQYGENKYKVSITPSNTIGDLGETGYIKYKKASTKYWETSSSLELIVELDKEYNIIYIDNNNNSIEKKIKVQLDEENDNKPTVIEITAE